ncbi:biotin/lipoyl-containing protein [candidate division KSB1 bacterium]
MEDEKQSFKTIIIEDVKYKTILTKKFETRKSFTIDNPKQITAFIPGGIKNVFVKKGKKVRTGERLLTLEAMKMYNQILAPMDGTIKAIHVEVGENVAKNQLLIEFR